MTERRWRVRAGDGDVVGAIVARAAPGDATAIAEGRVFVGRRRVRAADEPVRAGDEVVVAAAEGGSAAGVQVLFEGRGWVAVDKPAGIPTIPDQGGAAHALIALAARTLSLDPARLHPTSRLDRDVSGVVVFALDRAASERLRAARERHAYDRRYLALASRSPTPAEGTWDVPIGRGRDPRHRAPNGRDAVDAKTHYATIAASASAPVLLALAPVTGRTHQIRVHASHAGAALLGDRVYGGPSRATLPSGRVLGFERVFLHAARVTVEGASILSPIPAALHDVWVALGGEPGAWDKGLACPLAST